ncbi:hypothetical protein [Actinacidiphila oryziradicis]|jgi:hypothetical protein|uniref:Uncharacterized protein n=1 Tax=Actinacidiphila oryziradicis TaxID=2571141 RepID=A0A4U0SUX6_9ACTN|nr:hypothetical protein [Actinacidiphila oryziradicis]MCW2874604.1 hypothetical protein [Actinacidiphila oryziradicis]TKA11867.1 hypothetical protein FCI23_08505 [Actinacidiphila oryziradicis]
MAGVRPQELITRLLQKVVDAEVATESCPQWLLRPGKAECAGAWSAISRIYAALTDLELPELSPPRERRRLDVVLAYADGSHQVLEVDERQHFTTARAISLAHYPETTPLGYNRKAWAGRCQALAGREPGGKFAAACPPLFPGGGGRHRQRAFRDALADLLPPEHGWHPTVRISDSEATGVAYGGDPAGGLRTLLADRGVPTAALAG